MAIYEGLILEHFRRPHNREAMAAPEAVGDAVNPLCGDALQLFVTIESDRIATVSFVADACAICIAASSLLTDALRGMPVPDALNVTEADVVAMLGAPIPDGRHRCAALPLEALRRALGASNRLGEGSGTRTGVAAVVLAAGFASRFGGGKLSASIRGEAIIRRSVRAVTGAVDRVTVVVGPPPSSAADALSGLEVSFAINDRPSDGMSGSIRAGVAANAGAAAVLIVLGDQPFIPPEVPRALRSAWRSSHAAIVVPTYEGVRGHPVLFDRRVFPELLELTGDAGARQVVDRDAARVSTVEVARPIPCDVDTAADLLALGSETSARS